MEEFSVTPLGTVSPYSKGDSNCPGFLVQSGNKKILLDCGSGVSRLMKFPEDLKNLIIIISHLHEDHYSDLGSFANAAFCYNRLGYLDEKVKVYFPFAWEFNNSNSNVDFNRLLFIEKVDSIRYSEEGVFNKFCIKWNNLEYGGMKLSFLRNIHDILTYSVKIEADEKSLVYTSDTGYNEKLVEFAKGADLLISEATFLRNQNRTDGHMYAWQAGMLAKNAQVKKLMLTHFWPEIDRELYVEEAKEIFPNTIAAYEGKKLILR